MTAAPRDPRDVPEEPCAVPTLVEFLRARLDEDERGARATSPWPWRPTAEGDEVLSARVAGDDALLDEDLVVASGHALSSNQVRANVQHVARHDPARVLADVAAKRRIVELHVAVAPGTVDDPWCAVCADWPNADYDGPGTVDWPCPTQRLLALPFAGHPNYRPEWAPE